MNRFPFINVILVVVIVSNSTTLLRAQDGVSLETRLSGVVKEMVKRPNVVNSVAYVDFVDKKPWSDARGFADPTAKTRMTLAHQFRTASVAKTFTAVLVLQLIEKGELRLDDRVSDLLASELKSLKHSAGELQISDGTEFGHLVSVRQLLTHTSGIPDYFFEKSLAGPQEGRSFIDVWAAFGTPESRKLIDRPWEEPIDLLQYFFKNKLARHAKFEPGKGFHYSDTNYLLLGLIIEQQTKKSLAKNVRERILEPLGMKNTYYEWRELAHGGTLAHHFMVVDEKNHDLVEEDLVGSAEWANGGMVTTAADLNRFIRGLFGMKLFAKKATLDMLLDVNNGVQFDKPHPYFDNGDSTFNAYTFGLARWKVLDRFECWGHTGFYGIGMFYFPKSKVSLVFANNQVVASVSDDLDSFTRVLRDAKLLGDGR